MPSAAGFFTVLAGILAVIAGAIYLFGIPAEWKRAAEDKALETMGENKASYTLKNQISKLPASDQAEVKQLQKGLGNALGGTLQNPLGKAAGDTADTLTSPLTGR